MAEFLEVMKHKKRMCEKYDSCKECPMDKFLMEHGESCNRNRACNRVLSKYPQQAEEIIMKWAKENPVKTNADKFKEVFGIENVTRCVVKDTEECEKHVYCGDCPYSNFWQQEYKEPKGENNDRTKE